MKTPWRPLLIFGLFAMLAGAGAATLAEETKSDERGEADKDEKIEELERKLDVLTEEFEALRQGGTASAAEGEPEIETKGEEGRHGFGPAASRVYRKDRGVSLGGYGEWLYQDPEGGPAEADFLRLVLYTGYKFSDRILFNSEIEFEHASTGEDGEVSVEFAYLDFFVHPAINVRTGLVPVPVGLINEIHEPPTFLGARRPDVERVILPTTWRELGAGIFGDAGPVSYRAYLTTGLDGAGFSSSSGLRGGRQSASEAVAEDLAVSARVDYTGTAGLRVGISGYRGSSGQGQTVGGQVVDGTVTTLDVHGEWRWRGLEVRGLWAQVDVDDAEELSLLTGETIGSKMSGWYLQGGYDVLAPTRHHRFQLIPFVRYEELDTQDEVPASLAGTVTGANDREIVTYGVVFKPLPQIAIKADLQTIDNAAGTGQDQFNVAVGFSF